MSSEPKFVSKGDTITASWANDVVGSIRRTIGSNKRLPLKGGGKVSTPCPFGDIFLDREVTPAVKKIIGGTVIAGDKTLLVPPYTLDPAATKEVYLFFDIPVEVNRDDDNQLLLPGIKTTTWVPAWSEQPNFSFTGTPPVVSTGLGAIKIVIGQLKIEDGIIDWFPFSCGNIVITHCSGFLGHTRGEV